MANKVNSYSELYAAMQNILESAINEVSVDIEVLMNDFIEEWYESYKPKVYKRTYQFLHSCTRVEAKTRGNKISATVFIDTSYTYPDDNVSLEEVALWANTGWHGNPNTFGVETGDEFWNEAINALHYGKIIQFNFAEYLKSRGFSVTIK